MSNLIKNLNTQMNFEISSAYIYAAMSAYCKKQGMEGFAHFMSKQAQEELEHAQEFYNFIFELDEVPVYEAIEKPESEYGTFTETFKTALEHEKVVSENIRKLYEQAVEEKNYEVIQFIGKFITEQVEEEDTFRGIVERLERINESWNGLYIYDAELRKR